MGNIWKSAKTNIIQMIKSKINWISVKDKLPTPSKMLDSKTYLIRLAPNCYATAHYMKAYKGKWTDDDLKKDGFRTLNGNGTHNHYRNVTHWTEVAEPNSK